MEKLSEKQTPNIAEMRKTLIGLGNVLIQAELADDISMQNYEFIEEFTFRCGEFKYAFNAANPYEEKSYNDFVDSVKDFLKEKVSDYEKQIFALECAKAVMEVYLTDK